MGRKRYSDRSSTTFVVVVEITFFLESVFFFLFSVDVFPPAEAGSPTFFCCCAASCGFYAFPLCQEEEEKVCRAFQTTENLVQAKHTILYKQGSSILSGAPNNFIFDILTYFWKKKKVKHKDKMVRNLIFLLKRKVEKEMGGPSIFRLSCVGTGAVEQTRPGLNLDEQTWHHRGTAPFFFFSVCLPVCVCVPSPYRPLSLVTTQCAAPVRISNYF